MKTELDIVNNMLVAVDNNVVQSLEENTSPDVQAARRILTGTRLDILSKGWFCNTEELSLSPNISQEIELPQNYIKVTPHTPGVVDRNKKLYDRSKVSYKFVSPQKVTMTLDLPYEELPPELALLIEHTAIYKFYLTLGGDKDITQFHYTNMAASRGSAIQADLSDKKSNSNRFTNVRIKYGRY